MWQLSQFCHLCQLFQLCHFFSHINFVNLVVYVSCVSYECSQFFSNVYYVSASSFDSYGSFVTLILLIAHTPFIPSIHLLSFYPAVWTENFSQSCSISLQIVQLRRSWHSSNFLLSLPILTTLLMYNFR